MGLPRGSRRILDLIRALPAVESGNCLMRTGDRDISLSLLYMSDEDRQRVYACLGSAKAARVAEELARVQRARFNQGQYDDAVATVVAMLEGKTPPRRRSYYRPREG